ncbi:beta-hexosaminidase [Agaricicola taiwanensis]|uniref:beta-N-acetylhexosaminidase n=1 Tax=Agaricicola taiwanensis TaxID=591372 RepID=A0A8J2YIE5_9RHOB|nr:beta-N-acetylhexosaminidase [Agaricicola taiwanensis]GGE45333.1 beta-hexosaminidase [Agaricicola taiwanensis]
MSIGAFICGCAESSFSSDERAFLKDANPWGLILFARNISEPQQVRALCEDFRSIVGRADAPVLIDQEGGRVRRLRPPLVADHPPAWTYGSRYAGDPEGARQAARLSGQVLGAELSDLGITVNCAPVLDLRYKDAHDIVGDRAFGDTPATVADLGHALADGLMDAGVLPVVKHIPGHGRAMADSHFSLPEVNTPREELEATCFAPFRLYADAPLAMTAHVVYRSIDAERPATTSPIVVEDIIRSFIGFDGLLMSDDLSMKALQGPIRQRAEASISAGCDVTLHCNGNMAEMMDVAAGSPVLTGKAAARAEAALALIAGARKVDLSEHRARLEAMWRSAVA